MTSKWGNKAAEAIVANVLYRATFSSVGARHVVSGYEPVDHLGKAKLAVRRRDGIGAKVAHMQVKTEDGDLTWVPTEELFFLDGSTWRRVF